MPTPIQIQATKLELPFTISQLENKKLETEALVISLGLTFEGQENFYARLIALGISAIAPGEQYDSIDLTKSAGIAPVTLKVTEHPAVGLKVDTSIGTAIVAVEPSSELSVTIEESKSVDVKNKQQLKVTVTNENLTAAGGGGSWGSITGTITDQTDLVNYIAAPVSTFEMLSQNGSIFSIAVTNAGALIVIPEGSTAPVITTLPTTAGTEKVWYTLAAIAGDFTGSPTPITTWQWQRSINGTDWVNISGADTTTYTLETNDANNYIRAQQTETNVLGTVTASSAATGLISASIFTDTQWQDITPITWGQLTTQTWN